MDEDGIALTPGERKVLRLCAIPRRSGDIAFLYDERGRENRTVVRLIEQLALRALIEIGEDQLWRQTIAGTAALRASDHWSVVVDEVFAISGRVRPFVVCKVQLGVVYAHDWILCNGERLGRVLTVELIERRIDPTPTRDSVTLTLDLDVSSGDVLTSHEPMAAGG